MHRLVIQFGSIILAPLPPDHPKSISHTVLTCLKQFINGQARALCTAAHKVSSRTPAKKQAQAHSSHTPLDSAAQALADQGNGCGALKLLLNSAPPALYDDDLHDTVLNLYPQHLVEGTTAEVSHEEEETHKISRLQQYPLDKVQQHFAAIKTGKGAGPFSDTTDIFRNLALFTQSYGTKCPYIESIWQYLCLFATNDYPDDFFKEFALVWLTLLFKKWP
eukprot:2012589-Ditylum_brightwellii.AAC.1